jgi:hypothetical protein
MIDDAVSLLLARRSAATDISSPPLLNCLSSPAAGCGPAWISTSPNHYLARETLEGQRWIDPAA